MNCEENDCLNAGEITRGDEVFLKRDFENEYDEDVVEMLDYAGRVFGYVPRYYNKSVAGLLKKRIRLCATFIMLIKTEIVTNALR